MPRVMDVGVTLFKTLSKFFMPIIPSSGFAVL
jgi:hypothetical protein